MSRTTIRVPRVGELPRVAPAPGSRGSPHELEGAYERFLTAHEDRAVEVDGHRWRYPVGGHGSPVLVLPGGSMCPDSYFR